MGDIFDVSFEYFLKNHPEIADFIKNNSRGLSYDYFKKDFQLMNEDIEFIKQTLKSEKVRIIRQKAFEESKKHLENMEENRLKNSKMSKDLFSRYFQARNLVDSVVPHLAVFLHSRHITADQLFSPNPKERMELFIKHLNSVNVLSF